jgi:hypothetical protein
LKWLSPLSVADQRLCLPAIKADLLAQERPSTAPAGQAGLLLEKAIESRIVL